jgi:hypothetical protein
LDCTGTHRSILVITNTIIDQACYYLTSYSICAPDCVRKCRNHAFIRHADCQLQSRRVDSVNAGANDKVIIRGLDLNRHRLDGIQFASGAQLSVEQCFIIGFTQSGVEVALGAGEDVYVTNTYMTNVNKGVLANTTIGKTIVSLNNTSVLNARASGFEAQTGIVATTTASPFTSTNNGVIASGPARSMSRRPR